jgi:uncharacterized damage-inducible protein DinB
MGQAARLARHLEDLRKAVVEAVQAMDEGTLNTRPPGLSNSPGILVRHLVGSGRYWIHQVVGGEDVRRNREAEFDPTVPVRKEEVLQQLEEVARRSRQILEALPDTELGQSVEAQAGPRTLTLQKGDAVVRVLVHWAYHQGQLQLLRKLVGSG